MRRMMFGPTSSPTLNTPLEPMDPPAGHLQPETWTYHHQSPPLATTRVSSLHSSYLSNIQRLSQQQQQQEPPLDNRVDRDLTPYLGYALLLFSHLFFVISMYALLMSRWMPLTGNKVSLGI